MNPAPDVAAGGFVRDPSESPVEVVGGIPHDANVNEEAFGRRENKCIGGFLVLAWEPADGDSLGD